MSTYEEYLRLRVECGFDADHGFMVWTVWNGCEPDAQENMLQQLRAGAKERQTSLDQFGGDHW